MTVGDTRAGAQRRSRPRASEARAERPKSARLVEFQRARVLAAMVEAVGTHGPASVTVAHVVDRAGISRRTFYELFEDREDCLRVALEDALERAQASVLPAYRAQERWVDAIRAGLGAFLGFVDEEPEAGALLVVHALGAGEAALQARARVIGVLAETVDAGRGQSRRATQIPPLTAEGVVGAVLAILHARLLHASGSPGLEFPMSGVSASAPVIARTSTSRAGRSESAGSMAPLLGQLMSMIVAPYLGGAAAARELDRPGPVHHSPREAAAASPDPLQGLKMRLTHRTLCVLSAVAAAPGASNREIANAAGVGDQGQISKLLARLEGLGLLENEGEGGSLGAPNAWRLTARGARVEQAVRSTTPPSAETSSAAPRVTS